MLKKLSILRIACMLALLVPLVGMAQLSGNYTIDSSMATSGTNYQSFADATKALDSLGISTSVTFNVKAGTYNEQVVIPVISGASATNMVVFKGLGTATLIEATPAFSNVPVVLLDSSSYVTIDSLTIKAKGSYGFGIQLRVTDHINIKNCDISVPELNSNSAAGIIGSNSISTYSKTVNNGEYVTVEGCNIHGGKWGVLLQGVTGPITTPSKKVNYAKHNYYIDNKVTGFAASGLNLSYSHNAWVKGNAVSSEKTTASNALSIWDLGDSCVIENNSFYIKSNAANTRIISLAMAPPNGPAGDSTKMSYVMNNFVQYEGSNTTAPTGILIKNVAYVNVYNNTIKIKNQGSAANCIWLDNNNARSIEGIEIINNIMTLDNSGSGQFMYCGSSTIAARFKGVVLHHNDYYAPNGYFSLKVPNGTGLSTFTSFATYLTNTYSWGTGALNVDPAFNGAKDLHASAAGMNDSGTVISVVTHDIDGELRSVTNPDMGADEYTPPTCLKPVGLGQYNVTSTGASVYFTASNTGSSYKVQYGTSGFVLGAGTSMPSTNDTVVLAGLSAQTTYDVYVMEICSATDSSTWAGPITFTTPCNSITTYPYTESFNDTSSWVSGTGFNNANDAIDPCWSRWPSTGTSVYKWGTRVGASPSSSTGPANGFGGSGGYVYTEASYGSTGSKTNLTSVTYDLSSLSKPQLTFQYHMYGSTTGSLMVWIWDGVQYDTVWTKSGGQGASWKEAIVDLINYKGKTIHLKFHAKKSGSTSDIAIDEVQIAEAPPCPKVTAVNFSDITTSSGKVNYLSSGTKFVVEYGPTGFTQGTGTTDTTTTQSHTITGLGSDTYYDVYIQNNCIDSGKGTSTWVGPYTFKTLCSYSNYYSTNWDHLNVGQEDPCWKFLRYGPSNGFAYARSYDPPSYTTLQSNSGAKYYRYYNYKTTVESYLVSPEITELDSNNLQLRFHGSDTYSGSVGTPKFYIGTTLSQSDTANITYVDTIITTTNVWNEYTVLLENIPAGHKHVVIEHGQNTNYVYMAIDDLVIEKQPDCLPPTNESVVSHTDVQAIIAWTSGGASTFEIEYGVKGFGQGTGTKITGITDTTDTISGLSPQTCYEIYIRGNCTTKNSPWVGPIEVCTDCAVKTTPYVENFDGSTWVSGNAYTNKIDPCWTRNPASGYTFKWDTKTGATPTGKTGPDKDVSGFGNYLFTESSYGTTGSVATLTTPMIDLSGLTQPTFSFAYHMHGGAMGSLYVAVSDTVGYDTIFTISGQQQMSTSADWEMAYVDLSKYKGRIIDIKIYGKKAGYTYGDMAIDELSVDEMPACLLPINFMADSVHTTTAEFSWDVINSNTNFTLEYGPTGFIQGSGNGTIVNATGKSVSVSSLSVNTTYDIYLADDCDTNAWVGPVTFTTLIEHDAQVSSILSPVSGVCGDSLMTVKVQVANNGVDTIMSVPVYVDVTGAVSASINTTYTDTILPGETANIVVGNVNSYVGGMIDLEAYTMLSNDQDGNNDTTMMMQVELISGEPMHMATDTLCKDDTTGLFVAIPQTGIINRWYHHMNDTVPMAIGDTVAAMPGQTVYIDRAKETEALIMDASTGSLFGNMYEVYIKNDILLTGFTFECAWTGSTEGIAFWKYGSYKGHETTPSSWNAIDSTTQTGTINKWYKVNFTTPVAFSAGDSVSFYIANKKSSKIKANGTPSLTDTIGDLFVSTADFDIFAGVGGAYFGTNMTTATNPTAVSHRLHWASPNVCGNKRIALTMYENTDTALASFTHTVNSNGADVDFDGTASLGQVFDWSFGDGNTGMGSMYTHSYAVAGNYNVTLVVTDTICGTVDSITYNVKATVSLDEHVMLDKLLLYPNPNAGNFRVAFDVKGLQPVNLMINNMMGQLIYQESLGSVAGHVEKEINLMGLSQGVYILNVETNGQPVTIRFEVN